MEIYKSRGQYAMKHYGSDSRHVLDYVEEIVYLREWWILFVQGCEQVWFTPWYFFKETESYSPWAELVKENISNKVAYLKKGG